MIPSRLPVEVLGRADTSLSYSSFWSTADLGDRSVTKLLFITNEVPGGIARFKAAALDSTR